MPKTGGCGQLGKMGCSENAWHMMRMSHGALLLPRLDHRRLVKLTGCLELEVARICTMVSPINEERQATRGG